MQTTTKKVTKKVNNTVKKVGSYEAVVAAVKEAEKNGLGDYVRKNVKNWQK